MERHPDAAFRHWMRIAALADKPLHLIIWLMLDRTASACLFYTHYSVLSSLPNLLFLFYVQRDQGLYCQDIDSRVAARGGVDQ